MVGELVAEKTTGRPQGVVAFLALTDMGYGDEYR